MQITPEEARRLMRRGQRDPVWWVRSVLGGEPWSKQIEIMEAVRDHKEVAVKSCHGIGKDWTAARIALWFLYNFYRSLVITTGPSDRQVKGILWKELAVAHARARHPLGGKPLTQQLMLDRDWLAIGFSSSDPDRVQGWHAENVLVIIDEAAGVTPDIYVGLDGVLTSANAHRLEIGNPTDPTGQFGQSFRTAGVHKITVSAFDTPNFTTFGITEDDIKRGTAHNGPWLDKIAGRRMPAPHLVTPGWVASRYHRWGASSPHTLARIFGKFPPGGSDVLIPLLWIERSHERFLAGENMPGEFDLNTLGVDVARFGDDNTTIAHRHGRRCSIGKRRWGQLTTMETAGHAVRARQDTGATLMRIDSVGVGAGAFDRLAEIGQPVVEAIAGAKANEEDRFANQRSEWYWNVRTGLEKNEIDLDPADEELTAQLSAIKFTVDSKGRIVLESKDDMKARGLPSPDDADAVVMAFADGVGSEFAAMARNLRAAMGG